MEKMIKKYLPLSESAYYILLSVYEPKHGYGIIQHVAKITKGRVNLGAGTIYGSISKFEKDKIIALAGEEERRKLYQLTPVGKALLQEEIERISELYHNGQIFGGTKNE